MIQSIPLLNNNKINNNADSNNIMIMITLIIRIEIVIVIVMITTKIIRTNNNWSILYKFLVFISFF